jgi:hypothetical protein
MLRMSSRAILLAPFVTIAAIAAFSALRPALPRVATVETTSFETGGRGRMRVDPRVQARCALQDGIDDGIDALAQCLTTGPLAAAQIKVVGLVDPREPARRGTRRGLDRAEQLKSALAKRGVPPEHVIVGSQGDPAASESPSPIVDVRPAD